VLALCLGVTAMAFLRLPNLMIASVVLWLFFFYDIFWVFLSAHIFGENVMYARTGTSITRTGKHSY
jgi:hypothetical protein